jgi:transglutaminase-like putative cysteine protease
MRLRVLPLLLLLFFPASQLAAQATSKVQKFSPPSRTFRFTYSFTVKDIPPGTKLVRVWIPVAQTDEHQAVRLVETKAAGKTQTAREPEYGNKILYAELQNPSQNSASFTLVYEVTRKEFSRGDYAQLERKDSTPGLVPASMTRFVQPDQLIPTDGKMKALADRVTGNATGTVAKAKAAYDYLFTTMKYDKSGTGWGRGDAVWACDAKHGNCTDFHSPFIAMMRADGIPAQFDIGFPLPEGKTSGDIPGYHCWAQFYSKNIGWVPVDISEAWKAQQKRDYFFGTIDANRVKFSTGRDITLVPKQDGPPLNYFVYPYVEVDGKPYDKLDKQFSFEEAKSSE